MCEDYTYIPIFFLILISSPVHRMKSFRVAGKGTPQVLVDTVPYYLSSNTNSNKNKDVGEVIRTRQIQI